MILKCVPKVNNGFAFVIRQHNKSLCFYTVHRKATGNFDDINLKNSNNLTRQTTVDFRGIKRKICKITVLI